MFVDTSALIAILAKEPEAMDFAARIEEAASPQTSGLVVLETVMRLSSILGTDPMTTERAVQALLDQARIALMTIDAQETTMAVAAFSAFGKGRHPARLNLSDCMSYGCAKAHGLALLFKGNDFSQTDIRPV